MAVADYDAIIQDAAQSWNLDPNLIRAVMHQESGGNRTRNGAPITSSAGAMGLMQIMPKTAKGLGVEDPHDPVQAIYGGAKYLSQMLDQFGTPELAVAAYNAGPGKVQAVLQGRDTFKPETVDYVPAVASHYRRFAGQANEPTLNTKTTSAPQSEGVDAFLARTAKSAPEPATAPSNTESVDAFLARTGGKTDPSPAPQPAAPTDTTAATDTAVANEIAPPGEFASGGDAGTALRAVMANGAALAGNKLAGVPGAVGSALNAIGGAAARGFGSEPLGPNNRLTGAISGGLQAAGVLPPEGQAGTPMQAINAGVLGPVGTVLGASTIPGELAMRAASGLLRGGQEAVVQGGTALGMPQLARDIAAVPEALPFGTGGMGGVNPGALPYMANRLMGRVPEAVRGASEAPPLPPGVNPMASPEAQAAVARMQPAAPGTAEPIPGAAVPNSVGAAASPAGDANMTPRETQAYRSTAETQKLMEPQPVGRDPTLYVPGVEPTSAHMEQSANVSREAKMTESSLPAEWKAVAKEHNEARQQHFAQLAGSPVDVENAVAVRSAQAERDLAATWRNKTDADISPVLQAAQDIKASPDGKRPVVRSAVDSVVAELTGPDGKPVTDPEMLYGVRKHIDDLLSREAGRDNAIGQRAQANLLEIKRALDVSIEKAAPGFRQYLDNFAAASRPIDAMQVLQAFESKIVDTQGRVQLSRVQTMMRQIVESRKSPDPTSPFKSIPDETMAQLWALRDDLRRVASAEELAKARGSDTAQNALDMVKSMAGGGGRLAAGTIANYALPVAGPLIVNPLLNRLSSHFSSAKMARRSNELLRPDPSQYRPLAGPD